MKATAAVFSGANLPFEIKELEVTPPPSGYGRSSLIASGICGTDLHIWRGKLGGTPGTIIGHEFVGRLEECDAAEAEKYGLKVGDAVIADIAVPCGECILCKSGDDANCVNMQVTNGGSVSVAPYLWGGYCEMNYTPLSNLVKIPEELDPKMVATFACPGPTAIHAVRLARQAGVDPSSVKVAVVQGLGPVGTFAVMYLKAIGVPTVYAITAGDNAEREALALKLGADKVFNLTKLGADKVTEELKRENGGLGVDLCFEASGAPVAVPQGMNILRNRGVYLIPGQYSNSGGIEIQPQMITFKAISLIGSSQYSMVDVRDYLTFLCEHPELHEAVKQLSRPYAVKDVNRAFDDAKTGENIKTVLVKE